ncbi:ROK family transcriptional regulator [Microlunatus soli]|uniref:Sugar kinase of the NBD/HSP70 family, may contain an N-terminal HTH domain n=1 Tax=Microlunatus soli TaxID=630515 RepID=A0A1H1RZ45_9ACTN|nr:ROK family transcriptional regulator [Microlunatus soli]SDS41017.1 Sugar kinase of the NBD/HSP70 family, may contain an N-terminal HTH domain [Microlunatus soli]
MKPSTINADTTLLRQLNIGSVLIGLRSAPSVTLTELARSTGLSRQTAGAALDELIARGVCEPLAPQEGTSGRPARRYAFRRRAGHALGISFAPTHVLVITSDLAGEIVARQGRELDQQTPAAERLAVAEELARRCAEQAGPVWAVGAGTSGVVDRDGKVRAASQLPGWVGLDLAAQVGGWFDCPARAGNDAAMAALAERWLGNAQHVDDVVMLLTGHLTGFGLLIDGRVRVGRSGAAGELGKLPWWRDSDPAFALAREGWTADQAIAAAESGDRRAQDLLAELGQRLARSAAVLVSSIDPELVVVGGELAPAGERMLEPMRRELGTMCRSAPEVTASSLGTDGVALGALRGALDQIERDPRRLGSAGTVVAG